MQLANVRLRCFAAVLTLLVLPSLTAAQEYNPTSLRVFRDGCPHVYFFRSSEGYAASDRVSYEQWDAAFSRLMGIEGKAQGEELSNRTENAKTFTRFKQEHPDQLVLLHYNGNARDPRFRAERFFAGHWLYDAGTKITKDVPAENGEMDISVADPELFHVNIGRYRNRNDSSSKFG